MSSQVAGRHHARRVLVQAFGRWSWLAQKTAALVGHEDEDASRRALLSLLMTRKRRAFFAWHQFVMTEARPKVCMSYGCCPQVHG